MAARDGGTWLAGGDPDGCCVAGFEGGTEAGELLGVEDGEAPGVPDGCAGVGEGLEPGRDDAGVDEGDASAVDGGAFEGVGSFTPIGTTNTE